MSDIYIH